MNMLADKNRALALVIIGLIFLFGVLYTGWFLFFNNGRVVFEGVPPFNISIDNHKYNCLESRCNYTLGAREYSYTISKEGYFDQSGYVKVIHGESIIVSYEAAFEAKAIEGVDYPRVKLPFGYSKYYDKLLNISLFHLFPDGYKLKRLPKKINNIQFSSSGESAVLFEDNEIVYYKMNSFENKKLEFLTGAYEVVWNDSEEALYAIVYDKASKKGVLVKNNLIDNSIEKYVYFSRDIKKYSISVSPDERYLLVTDKTSDIQSLYIVDLEKKTRTNIFEGYTIKKGNWSKDGHYYIFVGRKINNNVSKVWMLNSHDANTIGLPFFASDRLVTPWQTGKFYFVSNSPYAVSGELRPYFSNFDNGSQDLNVDDILDSEKVALHLFDASTMQTYLILELTDAVPGIPDKIELDENGSIVRMLVGNKYYDVKVGD